jgi:hypothetical protein
VTVLLLREEEVLVCEDHINDALRGVVKVERDGRETTRGRFLRVVLRGVRRSDRDREHICVSATEREDETDITGRVDDLVVVRVVEEVILDEASREELLFRGSDAKGGSRDVLLRGSYWKEEKRYSSP